MYIYNQTFIEDSNNTCSVCANKDCSLDVTVAHCLVKIHLGEQPFHPRYQQHISVGTREALHGSVCPPPKFIPLEQCL